MTYLMVKLNTLYDFSDVTNKSLCIFECADGKFSVLKVVLRTVSSHWSRTLSDSNENETRTMTQLSMNTVGKVNELLTTGKLMVPTMEATRFFGSLYTLHLQLELNIKNKVLRPILPNLIPLSAKVTAASSSAGTCNPTAPESRMILKKPKPGEIMKRTETGLLCKICGLHVTNKKHFYVHFPGEFQCEICQRVYSRTDNLRIHIHRKHRKSD